MAIDDPIRIRDLAEITTEPADDDLFHIVRDAPPAGELADVRMRNAIRRQLDDDRYLGSQYQAFPDTTLTLSAFHRFKANGYSNSVAGTWTLPAGEPAGSWFTIAAVSTGTLTIAGEDGVTFLEPTKVKLSAHTAVTAWHLGSNVYMLIGANHDGYGDVEPWQIRLTDPSTNSLEISHTGQAAVEFAPFAMRLEDGPAGIVATAATPSVSGGPVDIVLKKNGTTMLTTNITIDDGEATSATAAVPVVIATRDISYGVGYG
jgi:hypothetical protein